LPIAGVTPAPNTTDGQTLFPTGNFRFYRPVYKDKTPPCNNGCPTGEQIQRYLDFVKHDRYLDGYLTILEDNPMPSVTGRICFHPCEAVCNRAEHDEPINIRNVERFLGDFGLELKEDPIRSTLPPLTGRRVAIVGSGPGGLACAYHLRRLGYESTMFEALSKPGGMLRAGIPHWHLPEPILDAEIAKILGLGGIEIRCNTRVGVDVSWEELTSSYDAVFLALGQDVCLRLPVEGSELRGTLGALEFLREVGLGRPVKIGKEVLVIGGGDTACVAARSAIRIGGGNATIVARRPPDGLRIIKEELALALDEGVKLRAATICVRILGTDGVVTGAVLCEARMGRAQDGTMRPEIVPGSEQEVRCDTVLFAIGQVQQLDWLPAQLVERGLLKVDQYGLAEGRIFAGGEVVRGAATGPMAVGALGDGKRAARNIHRVLSGGELGPEAPVEVIPYSDLNSSYFKHAPRIEEPLTPAVTRRQDQDIEVMLGYSREEAVAESDRCMSCGVCNGCDNCYIVCPDVSVLRDSRTNGHYSIRLNYCKGCLVCVQECPTGCLVKVPELDFDDEHAVTRMETAFSPYDGAHAAQSIPIRHMVDEAIAEYDAARREVFAARRGARGGRVDG
jgi:NADPH-dependent glutamate synthase beta subunit-like oxidoreductase